MLATTLIFTLLRRCYAADATLLLDIEMLMPRHADVFATLTHSAATARRSPLFSSL